MCYNRCEKGGGIMEKSTVYVQMGDACSYAIVDKGEKSVIIILKELECIIYDYEEFIQDNFNYHYLLLKHYPNTTSAYKDYLKLIGKMCKKSIDSKYFKNHLNEDNHIVFKSDVEEYMVDDNNDDYTNRKVQLCEFIKNNKDYFIRKDN